MSRDTDMLREDIENTRDRMSDTLDQLGERLNPNRIKQQVRDNVREATIGRVEDMARHAADRVNDTRDGLLDTIRDNPIPAAMIGIGLGWMLFNGRRDTHTHSHSVQAGAQPGYVGNINSVTPRLQQDDAAGGMGASLSHDGNGGLRSQVSDVAMQAREKVSDVTQNTRYQAGRAEDRFVRTMQDNPLGVGAVAIAVGMAAGFAIPETNREKEILGPARDKLVDRARSAASQVKERATVVAERVKEAAEEELSASSSNGTETTNGSPLL